LLIILSGYLFSQYSELNRCLQLSLKKFPNGHTWGVYLKTDNAVFPTTRTIVGTGQITIVAPLGFEYVSFISKSGKWIENARVDGPVEARQKSYISFGFVEDEPRVLLFPGEETLLFTFDSHSGFVKDIHLMDNEKDPFAAPNSYNSNPGNDLGIIDYGNSKNLFYYIYASNYGEKTASQKSSPMLIRMED
jgi:hypothetical protein